MDACGHVHSSNSFVSYDEDAILTCRANKADCQGTQTLSNVIKWNRREIPIFEGQKNPML